MLDYNVYLKSDIWFFEVYFWALYFWTTFDIITQNLKNLYPPLSQTTLVFTYLRTYKFNVTFKYSYTLWLLIDNYLWIFTTIFISKQPINSQKYTLIIEAKSYYFIFFSFSFQFSNIGCVILSYRPRRNCTIDLVDVILLQKVRLFRHVDADQNHGQ